MECRPESSFNKYMRGEKSNIDNNIDNETVKQRVCTLNIFIK